MKQEVGQSPKHLRKELMRRLKEDLSLVKSAEVNPLTTTLFLLLFPSSSLRLLHPSIITSFFSIAFPLWSPVLHNIGGRRLYPWRIKSNLFILQYKAFFFLLFVFISDFISFIPSLPSSFFISPSYSLREGSMPLAEQLEWAGET